MTALGPRTERLVSMLGLALKLVETLKKQVEHRKSDVVGVDQREEGDIADRSMRDSFSKFAYRYFDERRVQALNQASRWYPLH